MLSQKVYQKERLFYQIQEADINKVADLLAGRKQTDLPIVYVSYDCKQHKYSMTSNQINKLARDLIGTAYVLVEPTNPVLIDKISLKSKTCKVFRGYLGIYFPNVDEYIICNPHRKNLLDFVKKEVWTNSISQKSIEGITWKVLINAIDAKDLLKEQENEKKKYSSILHDKKQRLAYYTQFKNIENLVISPSQSLNWLENLALVEKERNFIIDIIQKIGKQRFGYGRDSFRTLESLPRYYPRRRGRCLRGKRSRILYRIPETHTSHCHQLPEQHGARRPDACHHPRAD